MQIKILKFLFVTYNLAYKKQTSANKCINLKFLSSFQLCEESDFICKIFNKIYNINKYIRLFDNYFNWSIQWLSILSAEFFFAIKFKLTKMWMKSEQYLYEQTSLTCSSH